MVGSNGIWPDSEPQSVREAYDNQRQLNLAGRREIPMTIEQEFSLLTADERAQHLRKLERSADQLNAAFKQCEAIVALGRLCKTYGIE